MSTEPNQYPDPPETTMSDRFLDDLEEDEDGLEPELDDDEDDEEDDELDFDDDDDELAFD